MKIKNEEMLEISGGAVKTTVGLAIIGGIVFLIGIIDGIFRPFACR